MCNLGISVKAGLPSLTMQNLLLIIRPVRPVVSSCKGMDYTACARIQTAAKLAMAMNVKNTLKGII